MIASDWPRYRYVARPTTRRERPVYDGDTFYVDLSLGLNIRVDPLPARLLRVDAAELHRPGGWEAQRIAAGVMAETVGGELYALSERDRQSFNRYLFDFWALFPWSGPELVNVNDLIVRRLEEAQAPAGAAPLRVAGNQHRPPPLAA